MLLLLFEVTPRDGHVDEYLEIAAKLRPELDASGGCLFLDRYRNLAQPRALLSLQVWRDEEAVTRWRTNPAHQKAQAVGRARVFEDYRLRVVSLTREESVDAAPWKAEPRTGQATAAARYVGVAETSSASLAAAARSFESIYRPGQHAHLFEWSAGEAAPTLAAQAGATRLRIGEVQRDYSRSDRAQAPQNANLQGATR